MLEGLDRVKWRKARHAYGSAADVPRLLRGLASEDERVRYEALDQLHASIFHQGNRYEATALAVPFLFELVLDPATHDREDLIFFLVALACGYESGDLPLRPTPAEAPQDWETEDRAAYDAVAERVASLAPLLREEPLRIAAAYALAHFPKSAAATAGDVRRAYDASADETTRATLLIALEVLARAGAGKDEVTALLRSVHGSDGSAIMRSSAASGLVLLGAADDDVVHTITAAILEGAARSTNIRWNDGDFDGYLARVLSLAAGGRKEALVATLIDGLAHAQAQAKMAITCALLDVVVPSSDYRALSDLQRRALKAIEEHGQWDRNGERIVNFAVWARSYGVPGDRDDFQSFVQAAEASARGEAVDWKLRERRPAAKRANPRAAAWSIIPFGTLLLLWLLMAVLDPTFRPRTLSGWAPWLFGMLGLGASAFAVARESRRRG